MKFDRKELSSQLEQLKSALNSGGSLPALSHIWFVNGHAHTYDGGLGIRCPLDIEVQGGIPGTSLMGLINSTDSNQVEILDGDDHGSIKLKLGKARATLSTLPPDADLWAFPDKEPKDAQVLELDSAMLEALKTVLIAKAGKPTRVEHHGILLQPTKEGIDFYATDSTTLARYSIDIESDGLDRTVLPRAFVRELTKYGQAGTELFLSEDHLKAKTGSLEIFSNALDSEGVADLRKVEKGVTKGVSEPVDIPPGLAVALERAKLLSTKDDPTVQFSIENNSLTISGKYSGRGEVHEKFKLSGDVPDVSMKASAHLIKRGLGAVDSFTANERAIIFYGGDNFVYLVASAD